MKKIIGLLLLLLSLTLVGCSKTHATFIPTNHLYEDEYVKEGDAHIVLLYGQSNATGCSEYRFLKEKDYDTLKKYDNGFNNCPISFICENNNHNNFFTPTTLGMGASINHFGPECGIAEMMTEKFPNQNTYIIKWSWGGSCLASEWFDSSSNRGNYYNQAITYTKDKLDILKSRGVNILTISICWMQGESDAYNDTYTEKYKENTLKLVSYLREDLGAYVSKEINFIDAFISKRSYWTNYKEVNKAKEDAHYIIQNSSLIKTNGEDKNAIDLFVNKEPEEVDKAHYDSLSMVMLGREFGKRIIELIS